MDADRDGFLNFREIATAFNSICKGDHVMKLRLFYCLHLPGMNRNIFSADTYFRMQYYSYLLGVVLPGELLQKRPLGDEIDGAAEEACDAEQFFDSAQKSLEKTAEQLKSEDETMTTKKFDDVTSLNSLQERLFMKRTIQPNDGKKNNNNLNLPPLPRDYFVHLWRGLHDLIEFGNLDDITQEGRQVFYTLLRF